MSALKKYWIAFYHKHPYLSNLVVAAAAFLVFIVLVSLSLSLFTRHGQSHAVPNFVNMSLDEALEAADDHNLRLVIADSVYVNSRPAGSVFRQTPTAGAAVKNGRRIFIVINSLQPRMVDMPNVIGYSLRQAKTVLVAAGLHVGRLNYVSDMATNNVLGQRYKGATITAGKAIPAESEIDLTIGKSDWSEATLVPLLAGYTLVEAKDALAESSLNAGNVQYDQSVKTYTDSLTARIFKQFPTTGENITLPLGAQVNLWLTVDETKWNNF